MKQSPNSHSLGFVMSVKMPATALSVARVAPSDVFVIKPGATGVPSKSITGCGNTRRKHRNCSCQRKGSDTAADDA